MGAYPGRTNWTERVRTPAIVAASLALHGVVLGYLALQTMDRHARPEGPRRLGPLYLDLEPWPLSDAQPAPRLSSSMSASGNTPSPVGTTTGQSISPPSAPVLRTPANAPAVSRPEPIAPAAGPMRRDALGDRIAQGLRRGAGCASPALLTTQERAACDAGFGQRAATAQAVHGTGDPDRDARFRRQGARELAAFEARREVRAAERASCGKSGPIADCEVEVTIDLFSSLHGFLPNLRNRED